MPQLPTSVVLEHLILDAPSDRVKSGWLIERLGSRSFGFVLLLLGICALLPAVSPIAGLLLTIPAFQMIWPCGTRFSAARHTSVGRYG